MDTRAKIGGGVVLVLLIIAGLYFALPTVKSFMGLQNFASCAARYGVVPETHPAVCQTPFGIEFVDAQENSAQSEFVLFTNLGQPIHSPLTIRAGVPGEAQPIAVSVQGPDGTELTSGMLTQTGSSNNGLTIMETILTFEQPPSGSTGLISILREGGAITVPVLFK